MENQLEKNARHIAIIMDGNGRWASQRGLSRIEGHKKGALVVREIVTAAVELGLQQLTLYCLSSENWKRPQEEIDALMVLFKLYLLEEKELLKKNNIRLKIIGRRDPLPVDVLELMDRTVEDCSSNTGLVLCLAVNYGGRGEIVDAVRSIVRELRSVQDDQLEGLLDEEFVDSHLYTAGMRAPDLLIRTSNERRLSNFLLWQLSYTELWFCDVCWPDFNRALFEKALKSYQERTRRFGGLHSSIIDRGV